MSAPQHIRSFLEAPPPDMAPEEWERLTAMLSLEVRLWEQGFRVIAGVDEAGRGPLAGPIVAAAVVLNAPVQKLNDSKKLSEKQRLQLYEEIIHGGHAVSISVWSAREIDEKGIQHANHGAMRNALGGLSPAPDYILVDGYRLSGLVQPTMQVIKGDARSLSIAAASIVAKVTRDTLMVELDALYPGYGFAKHKGYGTRAHLEALRRLGPCPEHRQSFAPLNRKTSESNLF